MAKLNTTPIKKPKPATSKRQTPATRRRHTVELGKKQNPTPPVQAIEAPKRTKTEITMNLLSRDDGASIADLQEVTGWQAHSVRGFLSGTLKKKLGMVVTSESDAKRGRVYRIAAPR